MNRLRAFIWMLICGIAFITGCSGMQKVPSTTPVQEREAPEWVMKGSGAFGGDKGKMFYGVASFVPIKNFSLHRSAADTRARNEAAKVFQTYTASLMKEYAASADANDPAVTSQVHHLEQVMKTVTAMTLSDVEIIDHWQHPASEEIFSLARLDLESFKDNFEKVQTLDDTLKDYIRDNAERMHTELEKEEALRRNELSP